MTLSLEQLGIILNVLGLFLPVVFSFSIARTYDRPYFKSWVASYALYLAMILCFLAPMPAEFLRIGTVVQVVLMQFGTWFLIRTAEWLGSRRLHHRIFDGLWWAVTILGVGLAMVGLKLPVAGAGPVLFMMGAHLLLAWELIRLPRQGNRRANYRLAGLLVLLAVWSLAYPLLGNSAFAWMGFAVSGMLHLFIGVEMVVVLLEDVAQVLDTQNQELQQLDTLKSQFVSTVSHELRTPLSAIKSAAWLLSMKRPGVDEEELVGIINHQSEALNRLLTDLLDFSKMESGALSYHKRRVGLERLAQAVVSDFNRLFMDKGLTLDLALEANGIEVQADADRLAQVFNNLLGNALKFTPEGGSVTVRIRADAGQARVEVQDNGPGVPAQARSKIFERFYQLDNSSTRKVGGAGLGLSIAKAIIEEGHQGRIWVESSPGEGSTFVFTLPVQAGHVPGQDAQQPLSKS